MSENGDQSQKQEQQQETEQPGLDQPGLDQKDLDQQGLDQPGLDQPGQESSSETEKPENEDSFEQEDPNLDHSFREWPRGVDDIAGTLSGLSVSPAELPTLFSRSLVQMMEEEEEEEDIGPKQKPPDPGLDHDQSVDYGFQGSSQANCSDDHVLFVQSDLATIGLPVMEEIRRRGKLCDVTLKVEDNSYHAHRIVLAATIPYFYAMFTNDMIESRKKEIDIQGIEPASMEALINFAYSGRLSINAHNVNSLMLGASFMQLLRVRDACANFLMSRLSPKNVLGVQQFADSLGCNSLVVACEKFVQKFFTHVAEGEQFLNLSFKEVQVIVNHDELHVSSEETVFRAVMCWVKFDSSTRREFLPFLLACVRLPLLRPHFLADNVATEELVRESHKCRDLLDEAKDYHLMPERRPLLQSLKTKPRRCKDLIGLIYAVGGQTKSGNSLSTVEVYDPIVGRWRDAEAMSMLRSRVGVAVMKSRLYAIGGYNGTDRLNTVEVFDAEAKKWSRVSSMNCKRSAVGAISVADRLYVCGGFDGISSLDTVEKYDPDTDRWTMVSSMTKHRSAAGVVQLYGKIYALGGHNGLSIFESVECFEPLSDRWTEVVPMLSKRCRLGVATLNGKIYACGGYDGSAFLKSVEIFDPVSNKWEYIAPMNVTRSRVALVSNMDRLWAIGGYDGMKNLSTVEMYNPEKNEWTFVSSMEAHEGGVGVGVIPIDKE